MASAAASLANLEFMIFGTEFGFMALTWSEAGLRRLTFPQTSEALARRQVLKKTPQANEVLSIQGPAWIRRLSRELQVQLRDGTPVSLDHVRFDLAEIPPFHLKVYEQTLKLEKGETLSYGELARRAGSSKAARAVGQALARNPLPILIPCHRVLAHGGKLGGFTAPGGVVTKTRLLALESSRPLPAVQMSLLV